MSPKRQHTPPVVLVVAAAVLLAFSFAAATPGSAQQPPPADTAAGPTAAVPRDDDPELPPAEVPSRDTTDTRIPPPLVRFDETDERGPGGMVHVWEHEDLLSTGALNLNELLEMVPGITPVRGGLQGMPQRAASLGLGGSRVEVILDGFVLDPLGDGTLDFSRLELVQLRRVRVERRLDLLRIELESLVPTDRRAYSRIEAGTGDFDTNLFRGVFLTPHFLGGPVAVAVERVQTEGGLFREPAQNFAGWFKWGIGSSVRSLELEARRASIDRGDTSPVYGKGSRTDWVLRARARPTNQLTTEAYFGASSVDDRFGLATAPVGEPRAELGKQSGRQAGVRAQLDLGTAWVQGATRLRTHEAAPKLAAELAAGSTLLDWLDLGAEISWADWRDAGSGFAWSARLQTRPLAGLSGIAEAVGGKRGLIVADPFAMPADSLETEPDRWVGHLLERTGLRAGARFGRGRLQLSAAGLLLDGDSVPAMGPDLDGLDWVLPSRPARGIEVAGRVPLFWEPLELQGSWLAWQNTGFLIYLPVTTARLALVYRHLPMPSGHLELLAKLEGSLRGDMRVPARDGGLTLQPAANQLDFYAQIRVLDVRAFLRWENILNNQLTGDLPGRPLPGQRVFYGVKWSFWN